MLSCEAMSLLAVCQGPDEVDPGAAGNEGDKQLNDENRKNDGIEHNEDENEENDFADQVNEVIHKNDGVEQNEDENQENDRADHVRDKIHEKDVSYRKDTDSHENRCFELPGSDNEPMATPSEEAVDTESSTINQDQTTGWYTVLIIIFFSLFLSTLYLQLTQIL